MTGVLATIPGDISPICPCLATIPGDISPISTCLSTIPVPVLATMPADSSAEFDVHLDQSMQTLQDMQGQATDIFISYCKDNIPDDPKKAVHPTTVVEALQKEGHRV